MKKKIFAVIAAVILLISCVPFIAGCSASVAYELSAESDHYIARCKGYSSALGGELVIAETYGEDNLPVTEIAQEGFRGTAITSVKIPASVNKIGMAAFANCNSLKSVNFAKGSSLTEIEQGMFGFCESLSSIDIPDNVTAIGAMAFMNCETLADVNLPEGLKTVGIQSFAYCYKLKHIVLPNSLEKIGREAFFTTALEEIIIPENVKDITTIDEEGKEQLNFGIGIGAFWSCPKMKFAVINAKITALPPSVFGACDVLETIYLPETLKLVYGTYIGSSGNFYCGHAFHNDPALKNVYFAGSEEQWKSVKIDETSFKKNNVTYDNSALINAKKIFNTVYEG